MSYINFNPTAQQGFQNALGMGMQMGAQAAEAKNRREYENALATVLNPQPQGAPQGTPQMPQGGGIVATPEQRAETERLEAQFPNAPQYGEDRNAAMAVIARRNPALYMKLQERQQAQEAQRVEAQLTQRALAGDPEAVRQMAVVNFDKWKTLDTGMKERAAEEAEVFGNAAMDVLNLPPQQRPQAILGYANRLGSQEIAEIADLPPQEQEAALRAAVAEAGMIKELQAMERPNYMAIPEGGTLVDTRNPNAVQQFGQQGNIPQVSDEAGYNAIPAGQQYYDPQGNLRVKGGTAGNGGGGF